MYCANHENVDAAFICEDCKKNICGDCAVNNNGQIVCLQCAKDRGLLVIKNNSSKKGFKDRGYNEYNNNRNISTFLTTVLSFIPGAGHMYLGFMRRGIHIMIAFFGIIALSSTLYNSGAIFSAVAAVVWFFGFFECIHLRRKIQGGEELLEDLFLDFTHKELNLHYVGIACLVIGGLLLLDIATNRVFFIFSISRPHFFYSAIKFVQSLILPAALIGGGFWILKRHKKNTQA